MYPDVKKPLKHEVLRLMSKVLSLLEQSIKENIDQWLWVHNRWKQQTPHTIYKPYRHEAILIILPPELADFLKVVKTLPLLRKIYSPAFLTILSPKSCPPINLEAEKIIYYNHLAETLLNDYKFKMVINFTNYNKINKHFYRLSAHTVLQPDINANLIEIICRNHAK